MTEFRRRKSISRKADYPTIDGYPEMLDPETTRGIVRSLNDLGGKFEELWKHLASDSSVLVLRREQDAYMLGEPDRRLLRMRLRLVARIRRMAAAGRFADRSLAAEEAKLAKELRSVSPTALAEERRQGAETALARRLHQQIPAARGKFYPLSEGRHLVAIRAHFVPEIVRRTHAHISASTRKRIALDLRSLISSEFASSEFKEELQRRVARRINELTLQTVGILCPFWSYGTTARRVSNIMKNARRRKSD